MACFSTPMHKYLPGLMLLPIVLSLFSLSAAATEPDNQETTPECRDDCTLVIASDTQVLTLINPKRSATALSPFSTFKIPNSLIALDLGVIKNLQQPLSFDKSDYPVQPGWPKIWYEKPVDLRIAFQSSAVPVYRQLATDIGVAKMQAYLDKFNYGNKDISSGLDSFWLNGSLKISADEQIVFLKSLYHGELAVNPDSLAKLKQVMLVEQTPDYRLYAKTGGGKLDSGKSLGWYVGYVENSDGVFYFAMNLEGEKFWPTMKKRLPIMRSALQQAGII
ncbi:hypothetical protein L2725_12595 [Shewanella corallii]|uniref:Beta-lactamase n=1 Tax=Shewanella corallii TaxID=560080 RepID=A0ABT0N825_9GAMM|nr:penicillin-binding transpeptidase domain-containing protein [Shewanella corallii]MCL2914607.1 hypothetical protein [Shewanella corallii]